MLCETRESLYWPSQPGNSLSLSLTQSRHSHSQPQCCTAGRAPQLTAALLPTATSATLLQQFCSNRKFSWLSAMRLNTTKWCRDNETKLQIYELFLQTHRYYCGAPPPSDLKSRFCATSGAATAVLCPAVGWERREQWAELSLVPTTSVTLSLSLSQVESVKNKTTFNTYFDYIALETRLWPTFVSNKELY